MRVFYFGADDTWEMLKVKGFRRRNTCLLKAISENEKVDTVFVLKKTSRKYFWRNLFLSHRLSGNGKVHDIAFSSPFPEKIMNLFGMQWLNRRLTAWAILKQTGKAKKTDILWGYWPKGFSVLMDSGLKGFRIFDADHNIIDDPNIKDAEHSDREKELMLIGKQADCILSSAQSMIEWYNRRGFMQTVRLRNGVDPDRFPVTKKREVTNPFVIGYCGTLSSWIDYNLFIQLIERNPDWRFVIIGKPYLCEEAYKLANYNNVQMLGEKNADEVVSLLSTFDVAINLYRKHPALDADSMKLYEYIAAGVPVVSTSFHQRLKTDFNDLILLADKTDDLEHCILQLKNSTITFPEDTRKQFIKKATWNKRADDFLQTLNLECV